MRPVSSAIGRKRSGGILVAIFCDPGGNGFKTDHLAGAEINRWPEPHLYQAAVESLSQISLHLLPLAREAVHLLFEEPESRAPFGFCPIERKVRHAQRFSGGVGIFRKESNPNAGADLMPDFAGHDRLSQPLYDPQSDAGRRFRPEQMLSEHNKFVTAKARDQVTFANRPQQALGNDEQHLVTRPVAICVVDLLEAIEVEEDHGMRVALRRRRCGRDLERLLELAAVSKPREVVLIGKLAGAPFGGDAPRRLALLFEVTAQGEDEQADGQDAAEQKRFVELDLLLLVGRAPFRQEDVDLERDVAKHQKHGREHAEILNADAVLHDEVPNTRQWCFSEGGCRCVPLS